LVVRLYGVFQVMKERDKPRLQDGTRDYPNDTRATLVRGLRSAGGRVTAQVNPKREDLTVAMDTDPSALRCTQRRALSSPTSTCGAPTAPSARPVRDLPVLAKPEHCDAEESPRGSPAH
jgi:hypothetical protein